MIDGLIPVYAVLAVAAVFARRRGASIERRNQLAWLGYVGVLTVIWVAAAGVNAVLTHGNTNNWIGGAVYLLLVLTPVAGIPVACVVGLVLLATRVLPLHTPVAVAGSTLAAAALFSPLHRRVQRVVDSRFNRSRYNAEQMVIAFAARLQGATDLDTVRAD